MIEAAKDMTDDEIKAVATYFSSMKWTPWIRVVQTDTVPKTAQTELTIAGTGVRVGGMCKGSGMIHPNMATMLAFVTTDAAVEPGLIGQIVKSIADRSFNQVTVDGDS